MNISVQSRKSVGYRPLSDHPAGVAPSRFGYLLVVSGALAAVTFGLVYLATFSYSVGF
jgi:hypothetical protein